ncbi:MAG: hypothetical protein SGARI_001134 [Bacillariaceae sp.]
MPHACVHQLTAEDFPGSIHPPSENEPSFILVHGLDTAHGLDSDRILVQIGRETFHIWNVQEGCGQGFFRFPLDDPLRRLTKTILLDDNVLVAQADSSRMDVVGFGMHCHQFRIYHRQQDPNGVRLAGWEEMVCQDQDDTRFNIFDMVHAKWTGDQGESRDELVYVAANTIGAVQEHGFPNVLTVGWVDKTNGWRNEIFRVDISLDDGISGPMGVLVCNKEWLIINGLNDDPMLYNLRTGSFRSKIDRGFLREVVSNPLTNILYALEGHRKKHVRRFKVDEDRQFSLQSCFNLDSPLQICAETPPCYLHRPCLNKLLHVDFQTDTLATRGTGGVHFFDGVTGASLHRVPMPNHTVTADPSNNHVDLSNASVAVLAGKGLYAVSQNNDELPKLYLLPSAKYAAPV